MIHTNYSEKQPSYQSYVNRHGNNDSNTFQEILLRNTQIAASNNKVDTRTEYEKYTDLKINAFEAYLAGDDEKLKNIELNEYYGYSFSLNAFDFMKRGERFYGKEDFIQIAKSSIEYYNELKTHKDWMKEIDRLHKLIPNKSTSGGNYLASFVETSVMAGEGDKAEELIRDAVKNNVVNEVGDSMRRREFITYYKSLRSKQKEEFKYDKETYNDKAINFTRENIQQLAKQAVDFIIDSFFALDGPTQSSDPVRNAKYGYAMDIMKAHFHEV